MPIPTDKKATEEDILSEVMRKYERAHKYVKDNYHDTWTDCWKIYNNRRVKKGYEGIADVFIPETFTITESIVSNITSGRPFWNFVPTDEEQSPDTDVLNNLMQYYWEANRMDMKATHWVREMVMYGNSILFVEWDSDTNMPKIVNIPLKDFFIDPTATDIENAQYAGFRYLTTKEGLKKKTILDPKTGEFVPRYKNLDKIETDPRKDWDELDKDEKESYLGSTLGKDAHKDQVEIVYFVSRERLYEVANRKTLIYNEETPFSREATTIQATVEIDGETIEIPKELPEVKAFLPFAPLRNYVDTSLFFAKGDVENLIDEQEKLNDIGNQKLDNITYVLNNMWQLDPQFEDMKEDIESLPGAVYTVPRGALTPIEKPVVTNDGDSEMLRIKDEMRRVTAADEVVQGVSQDKGRITATEVQAQLNQASQRFSTKLRLLESEGYGQLGRIMFRLTQIFVDQPMAVRILGDKGLEWNDYDPYEFPGEYEPNVQLEATTKAIKAEEGQKLTQLFQLILGSPMVNQEEAMRILMKKVFDLDQKEIQKLLDVSQLPLPPDLVGPGGGGETPSDVASGPLPTGAIGSI